MNSSHTKFCLDQFDRKEVIGIGSGGTKVYKTTNKLDNKVTPT